MAPLDPGSTLSTDTCRTCEGRRLLQRTVVKSRGFLRWKVQRFSLCRACAGTGTVHTNHKAPSGNEEVNMSGKHRKDAATKKKECRWCKGKGGFSYANGAYIRCGRCMGKG
ncbi:hypothetical protein GCM10020216_078940 [Nonomuraea helvata]